MTGDIPAVAFTGQRLTYATDIEPSHIILRRLPDGGLCLNGAVTLHFDPPTVTLAPDIEWDDAARRFWNAMAMVVNQPTPFL